MTAVYTPEQDRKRLAWLLRERAKLVRIVGLQCWEALPLQAKAAMDALAPLLDDAATALETVNV